MGTNYYARLDICPTCKRAQKEIHIGKASMGWRFLFNLNSGEFYGNADELRSWLEGKRIFNEYEEEIGFEIFWKMVEDLQGETRGEKAHPEYGEHDIVIGGYRFSKYPYFS